MTVSSTSIEQIQQELPGLDWITDPLKIGRLSQDFSWFSPVLKRQLLGKRADIVVKPRTEDEIRQVASACARHRIPLTVRGSGTGNYGQSTPLHGGVILDMSGYNAFLWSRPGVGRAQAGIRLAEFDNAARPTGWELRCIPSTFRSASLGGLFSGGFGGVGSINYGPIGAAGNILGIRAMSIEAEPQVVELRGPEALLMHHLWGTNGLVLEVEMALAPAHDWMEMIVTFDDADRALDFGNALAHAPGIVKKNIALLADPIPAYMVPLAEYLPKGCHAALLLVAEFSEAAALQVITANGGQVTYRRTADEVRAQHHTLAEYCWNHTTLNALKVDKGLTYLQTTFTPGKHLDQVRRIRELFGDEVLMHVEFLRSMDGFTTCTSLPLVRFTTEERLNEIIQIFRDNGIRVNNPHTFIIEEGKVGGDLPQNVIDMKKRFDPAGLLNPGKMRAWGLPD
ncbi:FAD-binding oxidoreductase [Hydrogenophaga sp. UC242_50]|jgi:FAD/FMN-containing dehydrogenase|uniref:FAD-binding oxidoreductase n=1 Tax=unclassified Hydrogenophaga TaxID=2610897 RepID=UPI0036D27AE4